MKIIPAATVVKLTPEERQILEALAGSRKAEARIHDRAWIGLLTSASMAPPTNAVVLSVDEKPSIQALERAQGYLKLPNGRAMIGQSHDCKRNGPSALFAALNVGTGHVIAKHYKRRRRLEFRDFMNRVVKQYEGKEIHVILDHLSTHKPKRDLWLARHPNVQFHYSPTHTSCLNQIEIWFSILAARSLKGASFGSVAQLVGHNESLSTATMGMLARSSGPKAPSTKNGSSHVSRFSDSGY
jgi:transposase